MIDESCFRKRGKKSAGVKQQYCGTTGRVENCQVGVFLSYVSHKGYTLIDRELYLPKEWTDDPERCREAGIPEETCFQTKCELARQMVERLWKMQIPFAWVVADTALRGESGFAHLAGSPSVLLRGFRWPAMNRWEYGRLEARQRMTIAEAEALSCARPGLAATQYE